MVKGVYSIKDEKVGFTNLFLDDSDGAACRGFAFSVSNSNGIIGFCPADFSLYKVGDFDIQSGVFTPLKSYLYLMSGIQAVPVKEVQPQ